MEVHRIDWIDELNRLAREHDNPGGYESMQIKSAAQVWQAERNRTQELCRATREAITDLLEIIDGKVPESVNEVLRLIRRIEGGQIQ